MRVVSCIRDTMEMPARLITHADQCRLHTRDFVHDIDVRFFESDDSPGFVELQLWMTWTVGGDMRGELE